MQSGFLDANRAFAILAHLAEISFWPMRKATVAPSFYPSAHENVERSTESERIAFISGSEQPYDVCPATLASVGSGCRQGPHKHCSNAGFHRQRESWTIGLGSTRRFAET